MYTRRDNISNIACKAVISQKRPPEPFPWLCPRCGQETVNPTSVDYRTTRKYEGRSYDLNVTGLRVLQCGNCGERLFGNEAGDQIERAFRATLGLLQPEEIRNGREELGLNQKEFAAKLRIAEESLSRWESGALVQPRQADTLIRLYFVSPSSRRVFDVVGQSPDFGRVVRYEEPPANGKEADAPTEQGFEARSAPATP